MRRLAACLLLLSCSALADERILDFHSDILVMQDGWIDVTETIRVRAEGKRIDSTFMMFERWKHNPLVTIPMNYFCNYFLVLLVLS